MIKARALAIVLVTLGFGITGAATAEPYNVLATGDGALVVWNESKAHLTVEFVADKIEPTQVGGVALLLDGRFFQLTMVDPAEFSAGDLKGAALLQKHMQFEGDYWNSQVGTQLPRQVIAPKEPLPPDTMIWEIEWPAALRESGEVTAVKNLFLTRIAGDRVMVVSTPVMKGESVEDRVAYFCQVADSIRTSTTLVMVEDVQERLRRKQLE